MTYQQLAEFILQKMNQEQMACDLLVYDSNQDTFYPAYLSFMEEVENENGDFINKQPYFVY